MAQKKKEPRPPGRIAKSLDWMADEVKRGNLAYVSAVLGVIFGVIIILSIILPNVWRHVVRTHTRPVVIEQIVTEPTELTMLNDTLNHLREQHRLALNASRQANNTSEARRAQQIELAHEIQTQIDEIVRILYERLGDTTVEVLPTGIYEGLNE